MSTSMEIETARFYTTRYRAGYDQREVDEYLERLAATMRELERGVRPSMDGRVLTPQEVREREFRTTMEEVGYEQHQVRILLHRVADALQDYYVASLRPRLRPGMPLGAHGAAPAPNALGGRRLAELVTRAQAVHVGPHHDKLLVETPDGSTMSVVDVVDMADGVLLRLG